jgi:hypothetical protein
MLVGMSGVDGINLCLNALSITAGMDVVIDIMFAGNYCPLPTLKINKKRLDSFFMIKIYFSCPVTKFIRIAH